MTTVFMALWTLKWSLSTAVNSLVPPICIFLKSSSQVTLAFRRCVAGEVVEQDCNRPGNGSLNMKLNKYGNTEPLHTIFYQNLWCLILVQQDYQVDIFTLHCLFYARWVKKVRFVAVVLDRRQQMCKPLRKKGSMAASPLLNKIEPGTTLWPWSQVAQTDQHWVSHGFYTSSI